MFTEIESRYLKDLRSTARIYKHDCGMLVFSMENDDPENAFSLGFSTTPENHTGVTHILEHSVLAGSKKYPVKEPFMEMIKGSLATFINALTYQDHTIYPIMSTVSADYFNLASVYFDAVFNPLLSEKIFQQEGWHLELEKPGNVKSNLKVNGIVYNEMRGYMAEIDEVIMKETYSRLLSKSPRRFISGGLPEAIPSLTYSAYKKYYRNHYHPSVARIFLYGNIPTQEKLDFLDKQLAGLDKDWLALKVEPEKPRTVQPRWDKPHKATVHFMPALDANDDEAAWATAFLLENDWDPMLDLSFDFLEYLLLGNASSPLKKAIQQSKLCDSIAISGYDDETPETNFIIAVTGVKPKNFAKLEQLINATLEDIAKASFTPEQINTAFMQYKASQQTIGKQFVYKQMEKVFDVWCYGKDPFMLLDCRALLEQLQEKLNKDADYLPSLIRKYLINNTHRLTLRLLPDKKLTDKANAKEAEKMAKIKAKLSKEKLIAMDKAAAELKQEQGAPNSPEALATLPKLERSQVPPEPILLDYDKIFLPNNIAFCSSDMFTNGMAYIEIAWPLSAFTPEQIMDLPLFTAYLAKLGTKNVPYYETAAKWAALGANCSAAIFTGNSPDAKGKPQTQGTFHLAISALEETVPQTLALLHKIITEADFNDSNRFSFIANELRVKDRDALSYYGYTFASMHAAAGLNRLSDFNEMASGLASIERNKAIAASASQRKKLATSFASITERLATLPPVMITCTGSADVRKMAVDFAATLPGRKTCPNVIDEVRFTVPGKGTLGTGRKEGLAIASEVSACARVFAAPYYWDDSCIPLAVFTNILSCGYLWNEVRIKGGAYGAFARHNKSNGCFTLISAQDPSPMRTFDVFDAINEKLDDILDEADLNKAVISTIKDAHAPIRPTGVSSYIRSCEFCGLNNEILTKLHSRCLALTKDELSEVAHRFYANASAHNDCAIGPAKAIKSLPKIK